MLLQALRKAGRAPFVADAAARRRPADVEALDPDLETFGLVLKGTKLYFLGGLFFAATTLRLVLASVSRYLVFYDTAQAAAVAARPG